MRANPEVSGQKWELDGHTITIRIPMAWKHRSGRKVIIAPDGGDAWALAKPRLDDANSRAGAGASVEADAGRGEVPVGG